MSKDRAGMASVQIVVALIGVVGSLGVAWITTGAKFENELKDSRTTVEDLKGRMAAFQESLDSVSVSFASERQAAAAQIARLNTALGQAEQRNQQLQASLASLNDSVKATRTKVSALATHAATLNPAMFQNLAPANQPH